MTFYLFRYGLPVLLGYILYIGLAGRPNPFRLPHDLKKRPSWLMGAWTGLSVSLVCLISLNIAYAIPLADTKGLLQLSATILAVLLILGVLASAIYRRQINTSLHSQPFLSSNASTALEIASPQISRAKHHADDSNIGNPTADTASRAAPVRLDLTPFHTRSKHSCAQDCTDAPIYDQCETNKSNRCIEHDDQEPPIVAAFLDVADLQFLNTHELPAANNDSGASLENALLQESQADTQLENTMEKNLNTTLKHDSDDNENDFDATILEEFHYTLLDLDSSQINELSLELIPVDMHGISLPPATSEPTNEFEYNPDFFDDSDPLLALDIREAEALDAHFNEEFDRDLSDEADGYLDEDLNTSFYSIEKSGDTTSTRTNTQKNAPADTPAGTDTNADATAEAKPEPDVETARANTEKKAEKVSISNSNWIPVADSNANKVTTSNRSLQESTDDTRYMDAQYVDIAQLLTHPTLIAISGKPPADLEADSQSHFHAQYIGYAKPQLKSVSTYSIFKSIPVSANTGGTGETKTLCSDEKQKIGTTIDATSQSMTDEDSTRPINSKNDTNTNINTEVAVDTGADSKAEPDANLHITANENVDSRDDSSDSPFEHQQLNESKVKRNTQQQQLLLTHMPLTSPASDSQRSQAYQSSLDKQALQNTQSPRSANETQASVEHLQDKLQQSLIIQASLETTLNNEKEKRLAVEAALQLLKQSLVRSKHELRRSHAARAKTLSTANKAVAFARQTLEVRASLEQQLEQAKRTLDRRQCTVRSLIRALEHERQPSQKEIAKPNETLIEQYKPAEESPSANNSIPNSKVDSAEHAADSPNHPNSMLTQTISTDQ